MGMPINNYTLLRALTPQAQNYEKEIAKSIFKQFNLFAFIIHIPEIHIEFDDFINEKFEELDHCTNDQLLFFSLCNPPAKWLKNAKGRKYVRHLRSYSGNYSEDSNSQIISNDKLAAALTLMHALNLDFNQLPCIVVVDNFNSNKYVLIKTDPLKLIQQLSALGFAAKNTHQYILEIISGNTRDYGETEIKYIGTNRYNNERGMKNYSFTLADALSNALSFIALNSNLGDYEKRIAGENVRKILYNQFDSFKRLKQENFGIDEIKNKIIKRSLKISAYAANLVQDKYNSLNFAYENLEAESICILKTVEKISEILYYSSREVIKNNRNQISFETFETSPFIISYGKMFEIEIDLSIGQWIRKYLGIILPNFYNIPEPCKTVKYFPQIINPKPIDFNNNRDGRLLMPGLGQTELAFYDFRTIFTQENSWEVNRTEKFIENWKIIRELRNRAGHTEIMTNNDLQKIKNKLIYLENQEIFKYLNILKKKLKF